MKARQSIPSTPCYYHAWFMTHFCLSPLALNMAAQLLQLDNHTCFTFFCPSREARAVQTCLYFQQCLFFLVSGCRTSVIRLCTLENTSCISQERLTRFLPGVLVIMCFTFQVVKNKCKKLVCSNDSSQTGPGQWRLISEEG